MKTRSTLLPFLAVALLAAVPAATAATAATPPADAAALIDAHVRWLGGWAAVEAVHDIDLEGTIAVAGLSGSLTVQLRRDGRQRTAVDLKVMKSVEGLAGDDAWELNPSGQVEEMGRDKATLARRSLDRAFGRHLRGEGVTVSVAGSEEKEGRAWSVVRFTYPDSDRYDLLVDPRTGESAWSRTVEDGRTSWTKASDLRLVDGVRTSFRQESFGEHPAENQVVTWQRVVLNAGLADTLFARPGASARLVRLPAGATATDWIPVELHAERYVFLRGTVNGIDTDIVLDSGAGMTVLDKSLAEQAGLHSAGAIAARGTGGQTEAGLVSGVNLRLGGLEIGPLAAAVIDLGEVGRRLGRPLPAILGKEVFHALVVDLDYPNSRIRFLDPAAFRYEGPGHRLELLPSEDGHKSLMMSIEGGEPVVVGLDTGQGGALSIYRHYAEERGLLTGRPLSERRSTGVGGVTTLKIATLRTVSLAGFDLRDVPVAIQVTDVGGAFDTQRQAANLGAGILSRFRVLFDYGRECLWLEPGPDMSAPFPKDRTGLGLQRADDALTVDFIAPGSPAEAAGWKAGEKVTALDGEPVTAQWWKTFARWSRAADGTTVKLTLADGTVRALTLKNFY